MNGRKRTTKKFPCSKWLKQLKQDAVRGDATWFVARFCIPMAAQAINKSGTPPRADALDTVVLLQHQVAALQSQLAMKNFELETLKDALGTLLLTENATSAQSDDTSRPSMQ